MGSKKIKESTTMQLQNVLLNAKMNDIEDIFEKNKDVMVEPKIDFYNFVKDKLEEKKLKETDVFAYADIAYKYGNKIITGERIVKQRDIIIRLCIAMGLTFEETQKAIKYYGLEPLYAKRKRDAIIIVFINQNDGKRKLDNISKLNEELILKGERPLRTTSEK